MPRFHFSIRDLLWLTLLVGMASGWLADRVRTRPQRELVQAIASEDNALQNWKAARAKTDAFVRRVGAFSGECDGEAQTREQYFICREKVEEAIKTFAAPAR